MKLLSLNESDFNDELPSLDETLSNLNLPLSISSHSDLVKFIEFCINILGGGFHPDTPFDDYVNLETNEPTFSQAEVVALDVLMEQAFEKYGDKIYDISLKMLNRQKQ